jgi:hypothetical protein
MPTTKVSDPNTTAPFCYLVSIGLVLVLITPLTSTLFLALGKMFMVSDLPDLGNKYSTNMSALARETTCVMDANYHNVEGKLYLPAYYPTSFPDGKDVIINFMIKMCNSFYLPYHIIELKHFCKHSWDYTKSLNKLSRTYQAASRLVQIIPPPAKSNAMNILMGNSAKQVGKKQKGVDKHDTSTSSSLSTAMTIDSNNKVTDMASVPLPVDNNKDHVEKRSKTNKPALRRK